MIKNPFDLSGQTAVVTGAGQGLGLEFALALANAGANVVVAEINEETGAQAEAQIQGLGREALHVHTDVREIESVEALTRRSVEHFGRIDILVSNAGITIWGAAESLPLEDWHGVVDVNLNGVYYCCRAFGAVMIGQKCGSIINIASMSGLVANVPQLQASYNATKAAVIHLTRSLAVEWAHHNVRVNAISPGYMDTPMARPFLADPKYGGVWMDRIPMGRPGRPEELGPLCVFLASEASSYMTGSNVVIDGGYTAV
jgi:NAD(P)-dependent dehydrogenase (short-subunit alcohol dehydrogenase family)